MGLTIREVCLRFLRDPTRSTRSKQQTVGEYARRFHLHMLVETGTYRGDMVSRNRKRFDQIVSIELDPDLHAGSARRFARYDHVRILLGNSADVLPGIVQEIVRPCLFWLDGHFSGGKSAKGPSNTPVMDELRTILGSPIRRHVILIDDARLFDGTSDYPALDQVARLVGDRWPGSVFRVADDIIRIHPAVETPGGPR